jgi:large subunit ribosomal protein L21
MFAVVETGGKQYRVVKGLVLKVEKIDGEKGSKVKLDKVMAVGGDHPQIGNPYIEGASVTFEVVDQIRGNKVLVFKKRRRQNYRRTHGHRQDLTVLRVSDIHNKKTASSKE